jgi:hypothetical protein
MQKYITIVIRADDEISARSLVPGQMIGPNVIVGCSLGDVLKLSDAFKELIPEEKEDEVGELEGASLKPFLPK